MKTKLGTVAILVIGLVLWGIAYIHADKSPYKRAPETDAQVVAAINELGRFAAVHNIDIDETWRDDGNSPWTARLYMLNKDSEIVTTWEESGYDRLANAVSAVETAYSFCPNGGIGHKDAKGNHHLECK